MASNSVQSFENYQQMLARILSQDALNTGPIQSPWQGASRMAMAALLGAHLGKEKGMEEEFRKESLKRPGLEEKPSGPSLAEALIPKPAEAAPTATADTSLPRGIRNNNPLNIEAGPFTSGQPGFAGSDGRFARFEAPQQGVDAAGKLLDVYGQKHGLNTIAGIVGRWAPAGADNNPTSAYAAAVARDMGVDPNAPLDLSNPETKQKLIMAMGRFENGRPIQMAMAQPQSRMPVINPPGGAAPMPPVQPPGNAVPMPNAAGPQMAQAQPPAPQPPPQGMAQPRPAVEIPPQVAAQIRSWLSSPNPRLRALGEAEYQKWSKPAEFEYKEVDGRLVRTSKTGGLPQDVTPNLPGYRPLVDPAERARFGIPAEDKRPYQVGANNKLINPPPETRVNIDQRGESKFAEKGLGQLGEDFAGVVKAGRDAKQGVSDIKNLAVLFDAIGTGKLAEAKAIIGPYAQALGVDVKGLSEIQAADSIMARLGPSLRTPGSGAQSDYELKQFIKSMGSIGNTPEGNAIITGSLQGMYQNRVRAGEIANRALAGEIKPQEADKLIRELPDPMEAWREHMKKARGASGDGWREISPGVRIRERP